MSETVINVKCVSKLYKLYDRPMDRLKESLGLTRKKLYKEHYALRDVSFQVNRGETVGIIGTNGSGKSTMLKIVTGVLNPTEGEVEIQGRISALLELGAGFNMEYTGIENVYLNGTMNGFSREEIDERLNDILEFADIGDFVHQPVKTYSSGMFVRLAFAVAINIDPEILIVDEALSVGDVFFQAKCYHKFEEFKKLGKTILFVSHDLSSISKYCDRVVLLNKGGKLAEGSARDMVDMYKKVLVNQLDSGSDAPEEKQADTRQPDQVWKNKMQTNGKFIEYGDKRAEIIDYAIVDDRGNISNAVQKNCRFQIKVRVRFNEDIAEPIYAFTLKDVKGNDITGTNTMYEKVYVSSQAGDVKEVTFEQEMNLQGGDYLLSLGCTGYSKNEFVVYHRLYDICSITVVSDKNTVGFYDMNSKISIRDAQ
ncbi:MAG: ABC transporter ATP-binding protein [Lachnospiraceae bacterium]|nr:ABC transporter ATP-binding protein [Lachnospiraceae bacterium]